MLLLDVGSVFITNIFSHYICWRFCGLPIVVWELCSVVLFLMPCDLLLDKKKYTATEWWRAVMPLPGLTHLSSVQNGAFLVHTLPIPCSCFCCCCSKILLFIFSQPPSCLDSIQIYLNSISNCAFTQVPPTAHSCSIAVGQ